MSNFLLGLYKKNLPTAFSMSIFLCINLHLNNKIFISFVCAEPACCQSVRVRTMANVSIYNNVRKLQQSGIILVYTYDYIYLTATTWGIYAGSTCMQQGGGAVPCIQCHCAIVTMAFVVTVCCATVKCGATVSMTEQRAPALFNTWECSE